SAEGRSGDDPRRVATQGSPAPGGARPPAADRGTGRETPRGAGAGRRASSPGPRSSAADRGPKVDRPEGGRSRAGGEAVPESAAPRGQGGRPKPPEPRPAGAAAPRRGARVPAPLRGGGGSGPRGGRPGAPLRLADPRRRLRTMLLALGAVLVLFVGRLVQLQFLDASALAADAAV